MNRSLNFNLNLSCALFFFLAFTLHPTLYAAKPGSMAETKKHLLSIYQSRPLSFLCETPFDHKTGKAQTALCANCPPQATPIQWMPVVSPKYYLNNKMCYAEKLCIDSKGSRFGGIRCCRKQDPLFQKFERDLHNLVPEAPDLKKLANKHQFGDANQSEPQQSACYLIIDKKNKILEPDDKLKGTIARSFLYMQLKYRLTLPRSEKILYENWHRHHPATPWERKRNELIKNIQGDANPYIG